MAIDYTVILQPILVWAKWLGFTVIGGLGAYGIYVYFFEYNVVVEYIKIMANGVMKEVKLRAKREDKTGVVKYKIFRSNLILKRPDDFSFMTMMKGRKEKIRLVATADKQYYFTKLNLQTMAYDCIPAEIEEWSMLAEEQLRNKYLNRKDWWAKNGTMITISVLALLFIITLWFTIGFVEGQTTQWAGVGDRIASAMANMNCIQTPLPDPVLPN